MAIGLPAHLRPQHAAVSFSRAAHAVALICLIADAWSIVTLQASYPRFAVWPALLLLVPIGAALVLLDRVRTTPFVILYVAVGAVCAYGFALVLFSAYPSAPPTDTFALTLLRVALALVGSVGTLPWSGAVWSIAGMAAAEIAILAAALQTGVTWDADVVALVVLGVVVLAFIGANYIQRSVRLTQPRLHRAASEERLAATRSGIEARAAALMHDTVLGHLAAISTAPAGPLRQDLGTEIARDLNVLIAQDWLAEPLVEQPESHADWRHGPLGQAVEEVRALGLKIDVSGDLSVVRRLDARRGEALALATKQCLVNVLRHAGTDRAELVIYGSDSDVGVMVVDEGRGFSEAETGADRLGLRQSVRQRMEAVDGVVQVWSAPGRGTSVTIRVPVAADSERAG